MRKFISLSACLVASSLFISQAKASPPLGTKDVIYQYDTKGQLTCAYYPNVLRAIKYTYDKVGNRTKAEVVKDCGSSGTSGSTTNSPPNAVNDSGGMWDVFESATVNVLANDSDPNGDTLTVTAATCNSAGCIASLIGNTVSILGTTAGTKTVTYTISDGKGGTDTATITVSFMQSSNCGGFFC